MQCERLIKLAKTWYLSVREETMAPARMVSFIEQHVASCNVCQKDPDIHDEVAKITEIVLPESKIPKAVRASQIEEADDLDDDNDDDNDDYEDDDSENLEDDDDLDEDDLEEDDLDEDYDEDKDKDDSLESDDL
jgi:hypothetical protein